MAYSLETSSVKTIVPGAEVSGFCDVVARQKINELSGEVPQLSAGEGIDISNVDGKTVITNNISAGSNISLVYDMETNTYRIDNTGAGAQVVSALGTNSGYMSKPTIIVKGAGSWGLDGYGANVSFSSDGGSKRGGWLVPDGSANGSTTGNGNAILGWNTTFKEPAWRNLSTINVTSLGDGTNYYKKTETSSKQELSDAIDYVSANAGHTYTGDDPIYVNNETDHIGITGESLSAGPNIDIFSSGGYVVISANGGGGGATYTGISPIDVNNTTHQISAKGVSFGVQSPLFFVQDDNEAVIIGCSGGGSAELISTGYRQVLPSDISYSTSSQLVDGIVRDTLIVRNPMGGMAQGGTTTSVTNYNAGGLDFSSHFVGNDSTEIDDSFTLGWKNCKNVIDSVETSASAWNDTTEVVQTNSANWGQGGVGNYVPLASSQNVYEDGQEGSYYTFNEANYSAYWEHTGYGHKINTSARVSPDGFAFIDKVNKLSDNSPLSSIVSRLDETLELKASGSNGRIDYVGIGELYHPGLMLRDRFAFMELASNIDGGYISAVRIDNNKVSLYHFTSENAYEAGPGATWEQIVKAATATNTFPASANEAITAYQTNSANYLTAVDLTPYQTTADMTAYQPTGDYLVRSDSAAFYPMNSNPSSFIPWGKWALPSDWQQNILITTNSTTNPQIILSSDLFGHNAKLDLNSKGISGYAPGAESNKWVYTSAEYELIKDYSASKPSFLTAHQSLADYQTTAAMTGYVSVSDYNAATARIAELEQVLQTYSGQWLLPNEGEE